MEPVEIAGLSENQRAFRLPSGQIIVIEMGKGSTTNPERELPIKVRSWPVMENGQRISDSDGVLVEYPAKVETINLSAVGEGKLTVDGERARATVDALERAERLLVAQRAWAKL